MLTTIGLSSELIILILAAWLYFSGQTMIALICLLVAIGGIFVFTTILPNHMRKKMEQLKEMDVLLEVSDSGIRHGDFYYPWNEILAVLRATVDHVPDEYSPIHRGDNFYVLSRKEITSDFIDYSPLTYSHAGHQTLQIRLSHFEKPDQLVQELKQAISENKIEFFETTDSRTAENFMYKKYK
ncbi:hypothetical protein [Enterococcus olivae]